MSEFLKSATTGVSADKSQGEIIATLGRYGASGFGFRRRGEVVEVTFHLPRKGADDLSVRIPVNVTTVRASLDALWSGDQRPHSKRPVDMAVQAERVAWRALLTWIDASLLAVKLGAQSMEEAFFAHLVVTTEDGLEGRLVDYVKSLGGASGGVLPSVNRLRLGSGS